MNWDDNRHWHGIFYVNKADPRLAVPKRIGWGRTLNYGHPMAWVWTFGAPLAVGVIVYLGKH
ncbi:MULTISPECIES: DUF5808 domain-containing protein [unclassified Streptomyces]|uniref:DUF5808 domain-containing protein n=1 Tax=unclassified Streptomyces TaxID=2593676 RepID=UPI003D931A11